ncbi:MAG TPA: hypothetical protein VD966_11780 [Pyrinomonadaceae bacterium]|nr:hypothetical protein [Pyrinomonadaceae bacterium]
MTEIGVGVLFALWFVTLYLLVSKLLRPGKYGRPLWREILALNPCGASHQPGARKPHLFLRPSEMGEHHSRTTKGSSSERGR